MPLSFPDILVRFSALLQSNGYLQVVFIAPALLLLLDLVTGVISATKRGTFRWKQSTSFLGKDVLKYLGVVLAVFLIYLFRGSQDATLLSSFLGMMALTASVSASVIENIAEITGKPVAVVYSAAEQAMLDLAELFPEYLAQFQDVQHYLIQQQQQVAVPVGQVPQAASGGVSSGTVNVTPTMMAETDAWPALAASPPPAVVAPPAPAVVPASFPQGMN